MDYQVRDAVLLNTRHLPNVGSLKLLPRFARPFCIIQKIGKQAYEVQLPPTTAQIYPVFHVSRLRLSPTVIGEQPESILIDGE